MRTQTWGLVLSLAASGCTAIVSNKLDDKPSSITTPGDGDGGNNGDGDLAGDGDAVNGGDGDGDIDGSDAGGDGDDMMNGDPDNLGTNPDGGVPFTRADIKTCIGVGHGCSLFPNGTLRCWGANDEMQASLTGGGFKDVACGDHHTCAVTAAGALTCVGRNQDGQRLSPSGSDFKSVASGDTHSCALRTDGSVACWGNDLDLQATPPAERFSVIAGGSSFSCGIRTSDSKIQCWGSNSSNRLKAPTDATFRAIDLGPNYGCGITTANVVRCWGNTTFVGPEPENVRFISMGSYNACAVKNDKSAECWPPSLLTLDGSYLGVSAGPSGHMFTPETGEPQYWATESVFPTPPALFYTSP